MVLDIFFIILGFALLINGANLLVKGASNIAKRFHISEMIIGLTIVAIGTSAPELIVTITSATKGVSDLIIGNAVGSNLCNLLLEGIILLILFIIYFSYPIIKQINDIGASIGDSEEINYNTNIVGADDPVRSQTDYNAKNVGARFDPRPEKNLNAKDVGAGVPDSPQKTKNNTFISIIYILIGIISLKYGGDLVVNNSINIARMLNIGEEIIGLTIIALGTSLPELATSIVAVIKNDENLAVGNIVGSCIFNLLMSIFLLQ